MDRLRFSVLMCVCGQDDIQQFRVALESITLDQTLLPDEIVLVVDGRVDPAVISIINEIIDKTVISHHLLRNEVCMGLAYSLNRGLQYCSSDWVARMDADDIAMPERFSKQISYLSKNDSVAVLGSSVREFGNVRSERDKVAITDSTQIRKSLKFRNPINHPSCVFNRQKVLSVGGYPIFEKNQDYGLWILMAAKGYKLSNLKEVLLKFRISDNFYTKRGIRLLKHDFSVLSLLRKSDLISLTMFCSLVILRVIFRALPPILLRLSYSVSRR
ncbi:glycosyltransferase [Pseudomonadales bacterium]|nr:glycosyltransferase [Pseudomonadales bacterium]